MRKRNAKEAKIYEALAPAVETLGLQLIDVTITKESGKRFLRFFIDRRGGVGIEHCEAVNNLVDPLVDQDFADVDHDYLEVSSAGLERVLETELDFNLHRGAWVELSLYQKLDGEKKWHGRLGAVTAETLALLTADGVEHVFPRESVAKVQRQINFDAVDEEMENLDLADPELNTEEMAEPGSDDPMIGKE